MSAPFEPHSPFGGSVATRVLRCPASVGLTQKVPAHLRRSSSYADRGTALHAAMVRLLDDNPPLPESLVGETIGDYTITHEDVANALAPVYAHVETLLGTPGAEFYLEQRVHFPTVAGAYGTADLLVRIGAAVDVVDFKFGAGVRVTAFYADGDDVILNSQLLFYAVGARHSVPKFFAGVENITLTILQPQSIEPDAEMVSSVEVTHAELDEFITVYGAACAEALAPAPRLARGDWCRFCRARSICPAHTAPLLDLSKFMMPAPGSASGYGDTVPGYALSTGRAERRWHNETAAIAALWRLGPDYDDIIIETMSSPKQVEVRAKARGLKVPPKFIGSRRSNVSLLRCENAYAPVPGRSEIARSFSAALEKALQEVGLT
jgi:hypothetical protein